MTTYTLENNVIRADGEYVCELIASDPQRLAAMMDALAQQPAPAVSDGWKLVPVELTPEMYNAFGYVKEVPFVIWKKVLAAAPAAPVAQEPVAWCVPPMTRPYWGEYAEADAKAEAARIGGTARAIPLYTAPPAAEQPNAWTPSDADYDRSIHHNPDAAAWADLFVATFPGLADKRDLMLGWFANAMMAMHDHLKAQQPDTVAVPRELLVQIADSIEALESLWFRTRDSGCLPIELVTVRAALVSVRDLLAGGAE